MNKLDNSRSSGKSMILLVDDSPKNLQVLAQTLKMQEYGILAARNGREAIEMIQNRKPDLILLDIMMPEMDGFETCKLLKESPDTCDIPVIFLTARTESEDIAHGFSLGAVDYVVKPFNMLELTSRIRNHLYIKKSKEELQAAEEETRALVHILCHDLANPIGQIVGIIDTDMETPGFLMRMKDLLYTSAQNGLETIDLVRKMTALKEGKYQIQLEALNLADLIDESLKILDFRMRQKNIKIYRAIDPGLGVMAEKTSFINSVINNLLTNAIKFSLPGGEIRISASQESTHVNLDISDNGIGMPESIRLNLFNLQKQTSRTGTSGETGTGFGMPLVKSFIGMYGGTIEVLSSEYADDKTGAEISHGTTIRIVLKSAPNPSGTM